MTPTRLLVMGAGGFLGSHVRDAIAHVEPPMVVTFVSRRAGGPTTGSWRPLDLSTAGRDDLVELIGVERPDAVLNCSGVTEGDATRLVRGNILVVADLLAAIASAAPGCRLVQVGTSAEYGAVPPGVGITADLPPNPAGRYGLTKLVASELVMAAGRTGAVDAVVLRVFNPIGSGLPSNTLLGRAAGAMRDALRSGERQLHLGSLESFRDFVDVDDVADGIVAAATAPGPIGPRILNLGSGRATQARDLVALLATIAGYDGEILEDDVGSSRSAAVPWQRADIEPIGAILGWQPRRDLAASVTAVWRTGVAPDRAA